MSRLDTPGIIEIIFTGYIVMFMLQLDSALSSYPLGIIISGRNQNVGHLGLANDSAAFRHTAPVKGLIPAIGFGLNAGSQSVKNPRSGHLVLGGYDQSSLNGTFFRYPIRDTTSTTSFGGRECPLQVKIIKLVLRLQTLDGFDDVELKAPGPSFPACIEP